MSTSTGDTAALDVALAYHRAWADHDFEDAMRFIDEDIVCRAPAGLIEGAAAFRDFMGPFVDMMEETRIIAAFGDEDTALVMYGTQTRLVPDAPGAEFVVVRDGRITEMRIIFDRTPFDAARASG